MTRLLSQVWTDENLRITKKIERSDWNARPVLQLLLLDLDWGPCDVVVVVIVVIDVVVVVVVSAPFVLAQLSSERSERLYNRTLRLGPFRKLEKEKSPEVETKTKRSESFRNATDQSYFDSI